jgi:hypothetical protein
VKVGIFEERPRRKCPSLRLAFSGDRNLVSAIVGTSKWLTFEAVSTFGQLRDGIIDA